MSEQNTATLLSPAASVLKDDYETLWTSFADTMRAWTDQIRAWAAGDDDLHPLLRELQWTPKWKLRSAVQVDVGQTPNVGSATGLFFEHVMASAIEARILSRVEGLAAHRNRLGQRAPGTSARTQPDLIFDHAVTGRSVVFEFKASPKSGSLTSIREQKAGWETKQGAKFFLVAGYADGTVEAGLADDDWAAILRPKSGAASAHTVDTLVATAVQHLTAATS